MAGALNHFDEFGGITLKARNIFPECFFIVGNVYLYGEAIYRRRSDRHLET
jgi:hypothetical protein